MDTSSDSEDIERDSPNDASVSKEDLPRLKSPLKVLITGGCGFLGRHIARCVYNDLSHSSIILLDVSPGNYLSCCQTIAGEDGQHDRIELAVADITNRTELDCVFRKHHPSIVFHCAGLSELSATIDDELIIDRMHKANVNGTRCVVNACNANGVKILVYTGSLGQALPTRYKKNKLIVDERFPDPKGNLLARSYGETKGLGERSVLNAASQDGHGLRTCSIRCPPLYGEYDDSFIPNVVLGARKFFGLYPRCGNPGFTMAAAYVGNAAHCHVLAALKLLDRKKQVRHSVNGKFFYVADDTPCQWAADFNMSFLSRLGFLALPWLRFPKIIVTMCFYFFVAVLLFFHVFFDSNFPSPVLNYRRQIKVLAVDHDVIYQNAKNVLGYSPPIDYRTAFDRSIVWYEKQMNN